MEMEINLQDYLDAILRRWKVVLVVFLAATLVATVVSFLQPSTYEASVTLMEQSYEFYSGPRLQLSDRVVVKLYPALARTQAVERRVIDELEPVLSPAEKTPGALLSMVTVQEDKDNPALFEIRVRADDPDKAAQIANTWAEHYLQVVSSLEADWSSQLEIVEQNLESAEQALASFEQATGVGLVEDPGGDEALIVLGAGGVELQGKLLSLAEHRQAQDNLLLLLETAQQGKEAGRGIDDLPLQLLNTPPITDRGQLSVESVTEQGDLDTLIQLLQAEERIVSQVISELATEVEQLQEELIQDKFELERLTRAKYLAEGAYTALTNNIQESQLFRSRTQILDEAGRSKPVGRSPWLNVIAAGVWGLLVGMMLALAVEYLGRRGATSAR
jgi:capsular polysaccharide biosynthesis protein